MAARLYGYWTERGYPDVQFWTETIPGGDKVNFYGVRSNLIRGLPLGQPRISHAKPRRRARA
jgi:hypothetical protein